MAPKQVFQAIIVAEDIRLEVTGKSILLGFLGLCPWVTVGVPFPDLPVPQLTFLCLSGDPVAIGQYAIELTILDPSGKPLAPPLTQTIQAQRSAPLGAIFTAAMLPLKGTGKYTVTMTVNGQPDFTSNFTITSGPPPPALR